jgi:anti-sigma regulatory factor (Ser/Thr protein kinase)
MTQDALPATVTLPRHVSAVRTARHWLADVLAKWKLCENDIDTAVLLLDEVFANAVIHAKGSGDTVYVAVQLQSPSLMVEVHDPDGNVAITAPTPRDSAERGRGLMIVDALAHRYGTYPTPEGKCAWFELFVDGGA